MSRARIDIAAVRDWAARVRALTISEEAERARLVGTWENPLSATLAGGFRSRMEDELSTSWALMRGACTRLNALAAEAERVALAWETWDEDASAPGDASAPPQPPPAISPSTKQNDGQVSSSGAEIARVLHRSSEGMKVRPTSVIGNVDGNPWEMILEFSGVSPEDVVGYDFDGLGGGLASLYYQVKPRSAGGIHLVVTASGDAGLLLDSKWSWTGVKNSLFLRVKSGGR